MSMDNINKLVKEKLKKEMSALGSPGLSKKTTKLGLRKTQTLGEMDQWERLFKEAEKNKEKKDTDFNEKEYITQKQDCTF
jgi:hypothetical protein